jgi:hypothetical protein
LTPLAQSTIGNARQWQTRHRSQHLHPQPCSSTGFPAAPGATRTAGNNNIFGSGAPFCASAPKKQKAATRIGETVVLYH